MIAVIQQGCAQKIDRKTLIEDVRQLAHILETSHPDPYIRGGGKIAFHRRLQQTLISIPEQGLNKKEFFRLVSPLVAAVEDGHTLLYAPYSYRSYGVPLNFDIVEKFLYVSAVPGKDNMDLIGSLLVSVEGVSFEELIQRQKKIYWYRKFISYSLETWQTYPLVSRSFGTNSSRMDRQE